MTDAAYDLGYASVASGRVWGEATIALHLGWLAAQLRARPDDEFRWGRQDALHDLLATLGPVEGAPA
jgi:hypothetical protein